MIHSSVHNVHHRLHLASFTMSRSLTGTSFTYTLPANPSPSWFALLCLLPHDNCEAYACCQAQSSNHGDEWHQQALSGLKRRQGGQSDERSVSLNGQRRDWEKGG